MILALLVWLLEQQQQQQKPAAAAPDKPGPVQELTREQIIKQDIESAIAKLGGDDYWEAALARGELLALARQAVAPLVDAFHRHPLRQDIPVPEAEKRARVRYWVCEILGDLRDGSDETHAILVRSLEDPSLFGSIRVCSAAAISLGHIGLEKSIDALIKALEGPIAKNDKAFRAELIVALGNLRARQAEALIREAFKKEDVKTYDAEFEAPHARLISAVAAEALGRMRAKDSVNDLARRIDEVAATDTLTGDPLWKFVVRALQRIKPELAEKKEEEVRDWAKELKGKLEKEEREKESAEKREKTRAASKKIEDALKAYKEKNNKYPATLEDVKDVDRNDGWGKPFSYKTPGTGGAEYDLVCMSDPDHPEGIWNHDKWGEDYKERTKKQLLQVAEAIVKYRKEQGSYPVFVMDLVRSPLGAPNYPKDGYISSKLLKDPWGGDLDYRRPGKDNKPFDLKSFGLDRKEGGEGLNADVSVWTLGFPVPDEKK